MRIKIGDTKAFDMLEHNFSGMRINGHLVFAIDGTFFVVDEIKV